jgi:hypothetical protein
MSRTGPVGRHPKSEPGTSGRKSQSQKIGATACWSNLDRTAKATSELLDGEGGVGRKKEMTLISFHFPAPSCGTARVGYPDRWAAKVNPVTALRDE